MSHDPHGSVHTIFIASEAILAGWSERAAPSQDVLAVADSDPQGAIEMIVRRRPQVVVVEQQFLSTTRGAGLVYRLLHDPDLPRVDVRVLPADHASALASTHLPLANAPASVVALAQPFTGRLRRAPRMRVPVGIQVQVDGMPAQLVDVSALGAQIVSVQTIRPNQRVRVQLTDETGIVRAVAGVAWSSFEMPPNEQPHYRVGMEFRDTNTELLEAFFERLATSTSTTNRGGNGEAGGRSRRRRRSRRS